MRVCPLSKIYPEQSTVSEFISRSGGATVRVRSPQLDTLRDVLAAAGLTMQSQPDALTVHDATEYRGGLG